ncbi:hypothetical protein RAN53_09435 [Halomonas sp. SSL-5]|uniref:hypothetical protein n=1 Tax=Halomonas sp. SSL-5 TaxID=3065855 RepID=UPI00273945B7|nr:hypothetical protein [Halomonas sp. SSL-5]MDY7116572.1 hypothetical protein [Halomonas sp. SSL-5]
MSRYLTEDRRRKPEGEHLQHVVKVRFTDAELEDIERAAAMTTEGRLAPLLRELVIEGMQARREHQARLLADLAEGKPLDAGSREALADLLARTAERRLLSKVAQPATA